MENLHRIHLRQIESRLGRIAFHLTKIQFQCSLPQTWGPAVNAYRFPAVILIAVDLAGVDKAGIELSVERRHIFLRGRRRLVMPEGIAGPVRQILAMEIDEGEFEREMVLPQDVEPEATRAEQRDGILWIELPLAEEAQGRTEP